MIRRTLLLLGTLLTWVVFMNALPAAAAIDLLEPGVSQPLAQWRAKHYRDVHYRIDATIAPDLSAWRGVIEIGVQISHPVDLVLDWRGATPTEINVNGRSLATPNFAHRNDHLIARVWTKPGDNIVRLGFEALIATSGTPITRYRDREDGAEYLYTLLVPADASAAFPCFDQPDLKARFSFSLETPAAWTVISNAAATESVGAGGRAERLRTRFAETALISTYLFAFAAGPLEVVSADAHTRLFARRSRVARAREEAGEVLRLNRDAIEFFERYFEHAFPFAKYDLVLIPEFPYGGMEHAGATFLREESVLFPSAPNPNDRLRRAQLIFHEASHQWFGNLVTMRWFDDLWLKEGFANFMAAKATAALLPEHNAWNAFLATKVGAYRTDVTLGTTPIYQAISNLASAKSAYGNIVYSKAPAVLRQVEFYLGERAFKRAVRSFVKRHARANAEWRDLVGALEQSSGRSLAGWADAWVKRRGLPVIRAERRGDGVLISQEDRLGRGPLENTWPQRINILLGYVDETTEQVPLLLERRTAHVPARRPVEYVLMNDGDEGYGLFLLDAESRAALIERLPRIADPLRRALIWNALWDSVREAEMAPAVYLALALALVRNEPDEITVASLLAHVQTAYKWYLDDATRERIAAELERTLTDGMSGAASVGLRITYLRAFMATASTESGRAALKALVKGERAVPGVRLSQRDRYRIVQRLLVIDDADARALLAEQERTDASDEGRRYAYAAGAAQRDAKARYFRDFLDDAHIAESWIEEAIGPFNAIEQASASAPYLEQALEALPRFARERKIFFVTHWLSGFIGGQSSEASLAVVQSFLETAGLDPDLRLKVLEALDDLERTVRIRKAFGS